jgi:hypothetical protein
MSEAPDTKRLPDHLRVRHLAAAFELSRAEQRMADVNEAIKQWMRDTNQIPPPKG